MHRFSCSIGVLMFAVVQSACSTPGEPTQPNVASTEAAAGGPAFAKGGLSANNISMKDACDPETFNEAIGPGTCVRNGGITFDKFIELLTKHQEVGAWHFSPPNVNAKVGEILVATNKGGEHHTFTEVEEFGGGIDPTLNELSGNPIEAPECKELVDEDFIAPGASDTDEVEEVGDEKYQCCIHPWMRTTIHVKK